MTATAANRESAIGNRLDGVAVLVVGLGKSGASTARYLSRVGARLTLTDSRAAPAGLDALRALPGVQAVQVGAFGAPAPLADYAFAVVSPGVPLDDPFVEALRAAGVELIGDIELFARHLAAGIPDSRLPIPATRESAAVIGITGSNGKSTVTTLVGEMAKAAGLRVAVGGNLGEPALDLLADDVQLYVLELSSFQLETTESLKLVAATMLNISPDHLDRHGSLERYIAAKARIYRHAEVAVVNRDDRATHTGAHTARRVISFGLDAASAPHLGLLESDEGPLLARGDAAILPVAKLRIAGLHNAANALAAIALAEAAGIAEAGIRDALLAFPGLAHRCEWVADTGGVNWINDSKGTNVGATLAALQGLSGPLVWLAGGQGKGQDFRALAEPLAAKARVAILFGQDAAAIERDLGAQLRCLRVADLVEAVQAARAAAQPGDRVLLSPACASLDQFRNYEQRGERFRELVRALASEAGA